MDRALLIGTWDLRSYELIIPNEAPKAVWARVLGQLIYTDGGTVSALIVRTDVAELKNSEVIAYTGRYRLQEGTVEHDVLVSNLSHYIGKNLSRKIEMSDGKLILTTAELIKGAFHRVTWERAKSLR